MMKMRKLSIVCVLVMYGCASNVIVTHNKDRHEKQASSEIKYRSGSDGVEKRKDSSKIREIDGGRNDIRSKKNNRSIK